MNKSAAPISQLISFLRFPATAGVVIIHGNIVTSYAKEHSDINVSWALVLENFFSYSLCGVCVPLFFFISGYLFFKNGQWNMETYKQKLHSRFHSLFVPYVLYTYMAILIFGVMQVLIPQMSSGSHTLIKDWSVFDFFKNGLWRYQNEGIPFCGALWYIRNLLCIVVLSPLIYWLVTKLKLWGICVLGLMSCMRVWTYGIPGTLALFYFSWGGVLFVA